METALHVMTSHERVRTRPSVAVYHRILNCLASPGLAQLKEQTMTRVNKIRIETFQGYVCEAAVTEDGHVSLLKTGEPQTSATADPEQETMLQCAFESVLGSVEAAIAHVVGRIPAP